MLKYLFLIIIAFLFSCRYREQPNSQPVLPVQKEKESESCLLPLADQKENTIPVARVVLADLLKHEKVRYQINIAKQRCGEHITLSVSNRMYKVDSSIIQRFLDAGFPPTLTRLKALKRPKSLAYWFIGNFKNVAVATPYLRKTDQRKCTIGGVNLSIIMYNCDRTEADLVVDFQRFREKSSKLFYAVHLQKIDENWKIIQKTYLRPKPGEYLDAA